MKEFYQLINEYPWTTIFVFIAIEAIILNMIKIIMVMRRK